VAVPVRERGGKRKRERFVSLPHKSIERKYSCDTGKGKRLRVVQKKTALSGKEGQFVKKKRERGVL